MAKQIYGKLKNEETYVPLEVAETEKEQLNIQREYTDVFGTEIEFWERKLTAKEFYEAKVKALVNLLTSLKN
jgi:hypothetical protein